MNTSRVLRIEATQSTNADAMRLAFDGERGPLWIVAREQRAGRGRRERPWVSPPGNLYASLLLTDPCAIEIAPQLGFVAGVALCEAVDAVSGKAGAQLKWPNDLLYDDAKCAGILLEAARQPNGSLACVAGIGVNCQSHPTDLPYRATDLSEIVGRTIDPKDLFASLDRAMVNWLVRWDRGARFAEIRAAWLNRAAGLGQPVSVTLHKAVIDGLFDTIDEHGRLVVATVDGPFVVDAGDVRFAVAPIARSRIAAA